MAAAERREIVVGRMSKQARMLVLGSRHLSRAFCPVITVPVE
ncbi:hypothetical protein ACIF8W_02790 [Streptomyces sp. NPDC085639]